MKTPYVIIIVLNWNGSIDTIECINSLKDISYENYKILIVDNGSTDSLVEKIKRTFFDILVIENSSNLGYSEGNNVGIRYAINHGADYVLILNNDVVVASDFLTHLIEVAEKKTKVGIIGGKILFKNSPDIIQSCGGKILKGNPQISKLIGELTKERDFPYSDPFEVDHMIGCALLISKQTIANIGMFDSKFFAYWEDTDLCIRAKEAGLHNYCVPSARLWHKLSSSTEGGSHPVRHYFMFRNRILFTKKHSIYKFYWIFLWLFQNGISLLYSGHWLKFTVFISAINGTFDSVIGKYGPSPKWLQKSKQQFIEYRIRLKIEKLKIMIRLFFHKPNSC